jgi:hypothetical protein
MAQAQKPIRTAFLLCVSLGLAPQALADPFQLGVEQKQFLESGPAPAPYGAYPAPQMMQPLQGTANQTSPMQGQIRHQAAPPKQQPLQASAQVSLPPAFLGAWLVQGQRSSVTAKDPQMQAQAGQAFAPTTRNIWNIQGNAQSGYNMSNDQGVQTALRVHKVIGNQAFISYQHPIGKTMAQEIIIMQLGNGGATFEGLERISIVKQGEPPRAQVKYQLAGTRQR